MEPASTHHSSLVTHHSEILLIHMGGLGDVCLSESTFLSLRDGLSEPPFALGNRRFLDLFPAYFSGVGSIEGRQWLHLFSGTDQTIRRRQIILIGKDRDGTFRERLARLSREPVLFIDMYPDREPVPAEEYQLGQLAAYGIKATQKVVETKESGRIVFYPEKEYGKRKWPVESFIDLYCIVQSHGRETILLEPLDLDLPVREKVRIVELSNLASFLGEGGAFVSNDSGIAHLAGVCGMRTITLFHDEDPRIWRPRGPSIPVIWRDAPLTVQRLAEIIKEVRDIL